MSVDHLTTEHEDKEVAEAIRTACFGTSVSRVLKGKTSFDPVIRMKKTRANSDAR